MTRAAVDQVIQLGVETVPGTQVPATKRLPGLSFDIKPLAETQKFRAKGFNVNTTSTIHKLWANGAFNGIVDYNSIVYALSGLIGLVGASPVQIGATAGYTWDFNPVSSGADPFPKTFTLEKGDAEAAMILTHLAIQSFGLEWSNDNLTMQGNLFGRFPTDGEALTASSTSNEIWQLEIDATSGTYTLTYGGNTTAVIDFDATPAELLNALTDLVNVNVGDFSVSGGPGDDGGTTPYFIEGIGALAGTNLTAPTADDTLLVGGGSSATVTTSQAGGVAGSVTSVAQRPASRMQADIFIDTSFGAIGGTKVTAAYQASLTVGDKRVPFWALNTDYDSFVDAVRVAADVGFAFSTAHNAQSRTLFNSIITNPVKYVRFLLQGENIGASADEMIRVDMAGRFDTPEVIDDDNGAFGMKYNFTAEHDASMGGAYKLHVVNRLTGL